MAELSTVDVEAYTNGLLAANDPEVGRMLAAALAAARRDTRWFVSPVKYGDVITLNATGTPYLRLPTKQVINISSITCGGVPVDPVAGVTLDAESGNLLINNNAVWAPTNAASWASNFNSVVVTMDHGFPEDAAAAAAITAGPQTVNGVYIGSIADDWRQAILALVVNLSQVEAAGRPDSELAEKQIDDVVYRWGATASLGQIEPILARYR